MKEPKSKTVHINDVRNIVDDLPPDHRAFTVLCDSGLTPDTLRKFPIRFNGYRASIDFYYPLVPEYHDGHEKVNYIVRRPLVIGKDSPKYSSPAGQKKHLYFINTHLENPLEWMTGKNWTPSPKSRFIIVEGIKKGLRLYQELQGKEEKFFIIVVDGVTAFFSAPESTDVLRYSKDRDVLLCFDADTEDNKDVRREELKLYAALKNAGARNVNSIVWDSKNGKGIDDLLHKHPDTDVLTLIDSAISPIQRTFDNGSDVRIIVEYLTKSELYAPLSKFVCSEFANELKAISGAKIGDLRDLIASYRKKVREQAIQREIEKSSEVIKDIFGLTYGVKFPEGYTMKEGRLYNQYGGLCDVFVMSHYVENATPGEECLYQIVFTNGKTVNISSDELGDPRRLAQAFNRHRQAIDSSKAKGIAAYLSDFWGLNHKSIPIKKYYTNTGWTQDGAFRLPELFPDDTFSDDIRSGFSLAGDANTQISFFTEMLKTEPYAGVFLLMMLAAPMVSRLQLPRFIVNIYGPSGHGKSTLLDIGASLAGKAERLVKSADTTKVGRELLFTLHNDLPVFIDELKTSATDGKGVAKQVLSFVFGYASGKSRLRGNIKLQLQNQEDFHGILFTTSNRSIESIMQYADTDTDGIHRRVLDVPVDTLWRDKAENTFSARYAIIKNHYGHILPVWIQHLQNGGADRIRQCFAAGHDLDIYRCKGTEKLLKLAFCVLPELVSCLDIQFKSDTQQDDIFAMYESLLHDMGQEQERIVKRHTEDVADKFQDVFFDFIANQRDKCVFTERDTTQRRTYCLREYLLTWDNNGEEQPTLTPNAYLLTAPGVQAFCQAHQFEKRELKNALKNAGVLADERFSKRVDGSPAKVWKLIIDEG